MSSYQWCDTCEDATRNMNGYCMECGTDTLWGGKPRKNLCAWCYVYDREEGSAFCESCNGDIDRVDEDKWFGHGDEVQVTAAPIPSIEDELERIPCRTRK